MSTITALAALPSRLAALPPELGHRLMALFGHAEPPEPTAPSAAAKPAPKHVMIAEPTADPIWPPARLSVVQRLWGEGMVEAGGADEILRLAVPLNPNSKISMLDLSAGLGGAGRLMHERFGTYITGLEANSTLAAAGAEMAVRKGMAAKATVEHVDPQHLALKRRFDCIVAREAFYHQPHLAHVLQQAAAALKPGGQFLFTDYVRADGDSPTASYLGWLDAERQTCHPWTTEQYLAEMKKLGLTVRVAENQTDQYRRMVLHGWANFLHSLVLSELKEGEVEAMVDEAELWMRRVAAFTAGSLRVLRVHALAPAEAQMR